MLIRFGLGGQLSGSVGGVVAGHNKGGQYLRNRSIPANPNSVRQQQQRAALAVAAARWRNLTADFRNAWDGYASQTPLVNRLGESITVSGFNMYVRTNAYVVGLGQAGIDVAPLQPGLSNLGTPDATPLVASVANGLDFVVTGATALGTNYCLIQYSPALSRGVTFFRGPYTQFADPETMLATGFTGVTQTSTRYGALDVLERRAFRIRAADQFGRLSNVFEGIVSVVA